MNAHEAHDGGRELPYPGWVDRLLIDSEVRFSYQQGEMWIVAIAPKIGLTYLGWKVDEQITPAEERTHADRLFRKLVRHVWESYLPDGRGVESEPWR